MIEYVNINIKIYSLRLIFFFNFPYRVAVEPLYPQVCQKVPVMVNTNDDQGQSPVDLSRALNSIACSLSVKREDPIALFHLVMEVNNNQLNINNIF